MTTILLILVVTVVAVGLVVAVWMQQRRTADRPFDGIEADAHSADQRLDDRQGWS